MQLHQGFAAGEMGFRGQVAGQQFCFADVRSLAQLDYRASQSGFDRFAKRRYAVQDRTTLFGVRLREPKAHAHPAVHISCSGEMLAGALRIARAAMKPTQAQMTMSDDRPHPARLTERQSFRVMSGGAFGIEAIGLDS
jgi:hypothetical protein